MNKNNISKKDNMQNSAIKTTVINVGAKSNAKLQNYKKTVLKKVTQEINKIEQDIKNLEQNKI